MGVVGERMVVVNGGGLEEIHGNLDGGVERRVNE